MLGWDSDLRRKESGRDYDHGVSCSGRELDQGLMESGWDLDPTLRVASPTYGLLDSPRESPLFGGYRDNSRERTRECEAGKAPPSCVLAYQGNEKKSLRASYLLYQLTCCVNHLYSSSLLSNIRPSLCDPSLHCVISVVYSSPSNNPGTYITDNNIRIIIGKSMRIELLFIYLRMLI